MKRLFHFALLLSLIPFVACEKAKIAPELGNDGGLKKGRLATGLTVDKASSILNYTESHPSAFMALDVSLSITTSDNVNYVAYVTNRGGADRHGLTPGRIGIFKKPLDEQEKNFFINLIGQNFSEPQNEHTSTACSLEFPKSAKVFTFDCDRASYPGGEMTSLMLTRVIERSLTQPVQAIQFNAKTIGRVGENVTMEVEIKNIGSEPIRIVNPVHFNVSYIEAGGTPYEAEVYVNSIAREIELAPGNILPYKLVAAIPANIAIEESLAHYSTYGHGGKYPNSFVGSFVTQYLTSRGSTSFEDFAKLGGQTASTGGAPFTKPTTNGVYSDPIAPTSDKKAHFLLGSSGTDNFLVYLLNGKLSVRQISNGVTTNHPIDASASRIVIYGDAGNDIFEVSNTLGFEMPVLFDGGEGNDTLTGGRGHDILIGGNGNDVLSGGGAGDDILIGGEGLDLLKGHDTRYTVSGRDSDLLIGDVWTLVGDMNMVNALYRIWTDQTLDGPTRWKILSDGTDASQVKVNKTTVRNETVPAIDQMGAGGGVNWYAGSEGNKITENSSINLTTLK